MKMRFLSWVYSITFCRDRNHNEIMQLDQQKTDALLKGLQGLIREKDLDGLHEDAWTLDKTYKHAIAELVQRQEKTPIDNCECANRLEECLNCANGRHDEHCKPTEEQPAEE